MAEECYILYFSVSEGLNDSIIEKLKSYNFYVHLEMIDQDSNLESMIFKQKWDVILSDYKVWTLFGKEILRLSKKNDLKISYIVIGKEIKEKEIISLIETGVSDYIQEDNLKNLIPSITRETKKNNFKETEKFIENYCHRQAIIAKFGLEAISEKKLCTLFDKATSLLAEILDVEFTKILELLPDKKILKLLSGVGWQKGLVGCATVENNKNSQAGFTLLKTTPVVVENLETETRFYAPKLLADHDVISGMSVIISGQKIPYGILGVHTKQFRKFSEDDINFLQSIANTLAEVIEQKKYQSLLETSLAEKEILLREIHHRVKNNLQIISGLIVLQEEYIEDDRIFNILKDFQNRIKTMSLIHQSLYNSDNLNELDISKYIKDLVNNLLKVYSVNSKIINLKFNIEKIDLTLDKAISCGLIVNELVSNSLKYAFSEKDEGEIVINLKKTKNNRLLLGVHDNGIGIPKDIDPKNSNTLGLKLISILTKQLDGKLSIERSNGTHVAIRW